MELSSKRPPKRPNCIQVKKNKKQKEINFFVVFLKTRFLHYLEGK
jgi:hypothetical protein